MPLYELEEGTSRKFYRIELHGTRVHLRWGRIGTEGEHQIIPCDNEAAARAEYQRQLDKRSERGYRKVVDETAPHDPEAIEKARLAKTGRLSTSPRFLFVHRKKQRFAWVEARGSELVYAEGPAADVATTAPTTKPCASEAAAIRERDARVASWMAKGYDLETFGKKETPKHRVKKSLRFDEALERAIAEDPYDDAAWTVLEDWVLQEDDPRAELVRLGKAKQRGDEAQARGEALPLLFGAKHQALTYAVSEAIWRAGHLVDCHYSEPTRSADAVSACFYASPAARLLRRLELGLDLGRFGAQLALIAKSPCARSLRSLTVHAHRESAADVDAAALAAVGRLETLAIHGPSRTRGRATLPSLRTLRLAVEPGALAGWCAQTLPSLRELNVFVRGNPGPELVDELAPLLAGTMAPALETLALHGIGLERLRPRIEDSPLRARLTTLGVTG